MKRFAILMALCCLTASILNAQGYFKMLPTDTVTWQHYSCVLGVTHGNKAASVSIFDQPIAAIDTISIGGLKYKKIYSLSTYNINYNNKALIGYMREDTIAKKIYFKDVPSSPDVLLYDFGMNAGDSMYISFQNNSTYNGYYRVDSIKVKPILAGPRKHFYLRKHVNPNPGKYLVHVESMGCEMQILYPFVGVQLQYGCTMPGPNCNTIWSLGVSCKKDMNAKRYQTCAYGNFPSNTHIDSCNFRYTTGNIQKNLYTKQFNVYPNPANETVKLNFEERYAKIIEITDITGQVLIHKSVEPGHTELLVDTKFLKEGMYFIKLTEDFKSTVKSILITH